MTDENTTPATDEQDKPDDCIKRTHNGCPIGSRCPFDGIRCDTEDCGLVKTKDPQDPAEHGDEQDETERNCCDAHQHNPDTPLLTEALPKLYREITQDHRSSSCVYSYNFVRTLIRIAVILHKSEGKQCQNIADLRQQIAELTTTKEDLRQQLRKANISNMTCRCMLSISALITILLSITLYLLLP